MNSHAWGYLFMMIGILGLFIINISTNLMMTNEQDYFILREVTEAAMIDSIDYRAYREGVGYDDVVHDNDPSSMYCLNGVKGQYRILKEKFVENFTYRFVNTVDMAKKYRIIVNEIVECPPKVTVTLLSSQGFDFISMFTPTKLEDATLRNQVTAIIETTDEESEKIVVESSIDHDCESRTCPEGTDKVGCECVERLCPNPKTCPEGFVLSGCDTCLKSVKATFDAKGGTVLGSSVLRCSIIDNNEACITKSVVPIASKKNFNFIGWEAVNEDKDFAPNAIPRQNLKLKQDVKYYAVYEAKGDITVKATFDPGPGKVVGVSPISCNIKAGNNSCTTSDVTPSWSFKSNKEKETSCKLSGWREVGKSNSKLISPGVKLELDKNKDFVAEYTCGNDRTVSATFLSNGGLLTSGSKPNISCLIKAGKTCCKTSGVVPTVIGIDEYHIFSKWKGPQKVTPGQKLTLCDNETYKAIFTTKERPAPSCTISLTNKKAIIHPTNNSKFGMGTSSKPDYNGKSNIALQAGVTIYGYVMNADGVEKKCQVKVTAAKKTWTVEKKTCSVTVDKTTSTCTEYDYQTKYTKSCLGKVDCEPCGTCGGGCSKYGPEQVVPKDAATNPIDCLSAGTLWKCKRIKPCIEHYPTTKCNCAQCCNSWSGESSQDVSSCTPSSSEDTQVRCSEVKHRYDFSGPSTTTINASKNKQESDYCVVNNSCSSSNVGSTEVTNCKTNYNWTNKSIKYNVKESDYNCPNNKNTFSCDSYGSAGEKYVNCTDKTYYCDKGSLHGEFCTQ